MPRIVSIVLLAMLCSFAAARAAEPVVLFSADTEGHLAPCSSCPDGVGLGGIARRATLVAQQRAAHPALLLVDAGNAVVGPETAASQGKLMLEALDAVGYDVFNVSHRDLRHGKQHLLALLQDRKLVGVSANLLDADTKQPLLAPFHVKDVGGVKVAVIGLSEIPRGASSLPHLRRQLAGVSIADPAATLADVLPKARAQADRVVVAWYGSMANLAPVLAAAGDTPILAAGVRPSEVPASATNVFATHSHGRQLGRLTLASPPTLEQVKIEPTLVADAAVEKLVGAAKVKLELPAVSQQARSGGAVASRPPADAPPAPGSSYAVEASGANGGARFTVRSMTLVDRYGEVVPAEGRQLLVLAVEIENLIPPVMVQERAATTAYQIPDLRNHLYLALNEARLGRIAAGDTPPPGHLAVRSFTVEKIGDVARGNLLFDLPVAPLQSLSLHFFDQTHGDVALPLLPPPPDYRAPRPITGTERNELVQLGVYGLEKLEQFQGKPAPEGHRWYVLDVRAVSHFRLPIEKRRLDGKTETVHLPFVTDWTDSRQYMQLLLDGQYVYLPDPATPMPEVPRFIPEVLTGDLVAFVAPAEATSVEFVGEFPNAAVQGRGVVKPRPLVVLLEGKRPAPATTQPIATIDDEVFKVEITGQQTLEQFAGEPAGAGQSLLLLEVAVANTGKDAEIFQTARQLAVARSDGQKVPIDLELSKKGPRPPLELLRIPASQRRAFQVVYRVPDSEARPRLAYTGISKAEVLALRPIEGAKVAAARPDARPGDPAVAPDAPVEQAAVEPAETIRRDPSTRLPTALIHEGREFPVRVPARSDRTPRGIAGVGLTPEQVNDAIDRGARALWQLTLKDMSGNVTNFGNHQDHTIVALALVHAKHHQKDPQFAEALQYFFKLNDDPIWGTYANGIVNMTIESLQDPAHRELLRMNTEWLVNSQGPLGSWGYTPGGPEQDKLFRKPQPPKVLGDELEVVGGEPPSDAGDALLQRVRVVRENEDGDTSVTQYALLGLHSAARLGIQLDRKLWQLTLDEHRKRQRDDGGWPYHYEDKSYGSMTAAGICAVALARHHLGEEKFWEDESIERGLAWLNAFFEVNSHPGLGSATWKHYYLYSIERVGRILDTEFIGEHEWYPLGARHLVDTQKSDGLWQGEAHENQEKIASSFALLFLTRATPTLAPPEAPKGPGKLVTARRVPPGQKIYIILDASGSMLEQVGNKTKFDLAKEAVAALVEEIPDNTEVALRVYGHRKRAIEPGAGEDSELVLPMKPLEKPKFLATLAALRARGKTPLAYSLEQAKGQLGGGTADKPMTVVLLTDGGEDTQPRRDPVKAAADIGALPHVRLNIVGFDISRDDWSKQLAAMTEASRGRYFNAQKNAALLPELRAATFVTPEGITVLDADGKEVARGEFGQTFELPAGRYTVRTALAGKPIEQSLHLSPGGTTTVTFDAAKAARK
jgi:Mg-chelatase subunit ChlD